MKLTGAHEVFLPACGSVRRAAAAGNADWCQQVVMEQRRSAGDYCADADCVTTLLSGDPPARCRRAGSFLLEMSRSGRFSLILRAK